MIIPSKINKGDEVILVAPSRKVDISALEITEEWLKKQGLIPLRGEHILKVEGIFAGSDRDRNHDLQWAFDHPTAKVIWCYRGGYGSVRLLENINPSRFLEKPKWIMGFSDITFLHCFSNIILNTASIHATMPINVPDNTSKSMKSLSDFLFEGSLQYEWEENENNKHGQIKSKIVGGNLSVLCATLGTNYQPDFEGNILFIEDIDEYYYAIDRLFWQLKFAGVFHHIKGLILGHFSKMKDNKIPFGLSIEEMVLEKIQEFDFPVAFNFPGGHENENWTLPFGVDMNFTVAKNQINLSTN